MNDNSFGLAPVRTEGKPISFDPGAPLDDAEPSRWMELCLALHWTRAEIHKQVEEWLDFEKWPK